MEGSLAPSLFVFLNVVRFNALDNRRIDLAKAEGLGNVNWEMDLHVKDRSTDYRTDGVQK